MEEGVIVKDMEGELPSSESILPTKSSHVSAGALRTAASSAALNWLTTARVSLSTGGTGWTNTSNFLFAASRLSTPT